ncbi:MAG: type II toxin-antitoxin system RelE/ParE family toxin [Candidatus Solibacter usitatus]|nr:type II toxin-antitoxin system RelE/ParE family toxin [Candidatus Solibacter usitatus]
MIPPPNWTPQARADLRRLDRRQAHRILVTLASYLATGAGDTESLHGALEGQVRLRVGDWRVIFCPRPDCRIDVLRVVHRSEAYR